jgi:hypothetical protein
MKKAPTLITALGVIQKDFRSQRGLAVNPVRL